MATWGKLLLAVDRRDVECVRSLLNEGKCRLSMQTKVFNFNLSIVVSSDQRLTIPNCLFQHGNTALHRAAKAGNREIVKLLLEAGAKPHATNHVRVPRILGSELQYSHDQECETVRGHD